MAGFAGSRRLICLMAGALCILAMTCLPRRSGSAAEAGRFHVNIGFSSKAFVNTPREDIRVAVRILSQKIAKNTVGSADSRIYDSTAEIEQDLKAKRLDAVALTPEDFLEIGARTPVEPVMVTATDKGHEVELILLTRKDSGIGAIRGLKNKIIAVPARIVQYGNMYFTWVETLSMREGFHNMEKFFSSVRETKTPSLSLMQVFFRQADACVVTRQVFELTSELNPQIGKELKVIERFGKLAGGIIVFRPDLQEDRKQKLLKALRTIHEDHEGRQLVLLFQMNRLVPYRPEYMRATEAFFAEHRTLKRRYARRR
jgi:ABC-type phosphate/phosphonate transport system substrate-binding protein